MKKYVKPECDFFLETLEDVLLASNFIVDESDEIGKGEGEIW